MKAINRQISFSWINLRPAQLSNQICNDRPEGHVCHTLYGFLEEVHDGAESAPWCSRTLYPSIVPLSNRPGSPQLEAIHNKDNGIMYVTGNLFHFTNCCWTGKPEKIMSSSTNGGSCPGWREPINAIAMATEDCSVTDNVCSILTPGSCVLSSHAFAPFILTFVKLLSGLLKSTM